MRGVFRGEEGPRFGGGSIQGMHDQALVGRVLEGGRCLVPFGCRGQIRLGMAKRMQLRCAAGKGKREGKKQSVEDPPAHARIIHAPRTGAFRDGAGYLAPARHWSRPAMKRSFGSFLPMNTMIDVFFSPLAHGLPTSPPIIMCTPWKTTRLGLPFIHSTPL
jgi:hypothetical protein